VSPCFMGGTWSARDGDRGDVPLCESGQVFHCHVTVVPAWTSRVSRPEPALSLPQATLVVV
jgi:hypothetical protein